MSLARTDDSVHRERAIKASDRLLASLRRHHGEGEPAVVAPVPKMVPKPTRAVPAVKPVWFSIIETNGPRRYFIQEVQLAVCEHFSIPIMDLIGPRRMQKQTYARQIAFFLCKELTGRSLPEIGRRFGDRDHTTVLHGVRKVERLSATDLVLLQHVNTIRDAINEREACDSSGSGEDQAAGAVSQGCASASVDLARAQAIDPAPRA